MLTLAAQNLISTFQAVVLGILLALCCAFATNLGFFFKHRGANEAPAVDIRHPFRTARQLYSSTWFCLGMLIALVAFAFHVAALALALAAGFARTQVVTGPPETNERSSKWRVRPDQNPRDYRAVIHAFT